MTNQSVANDKRTKLLPKIVMGQLVFAILITGVAFLLVNYTQGYRYDWKKLKLIRTGVLVAEYIPKDSQVYLNGKFEDGSATFAKNLSPGYYTLKISKDQYVTWERRLEIKPESVNLFQHIILFLENPIISDLSDSDKIKLISTPTDLLATNSSDKLLFNDHEIWVGSTLVTRYDAPILNAIWYPADINYIAFQQGDEIRIIERDGVGDTRLAKLSSSKKTVFNFGSNGTELYYIDGGNYKMARIR